MLRARLVVASVLLLGAAPVLTGCGAAENLVGGVVDEARGGVDDAVGDAIDRARGGLDDAVGDLLGGAAITDDGELPESFPVDAVPLTGDVLGGGAAPDSIGWVVRTRFSAADQFAAAQSSLESAGYSSSAVDTDSDSGFGTFTSDTYRVVLASWTGAGDVVTATWVVTPV